ncbi:hypothetical protein K8R04_01625 [Candidatus Uhrbacteria bacterium]|nr:hypothetical protein [Candidatus Uhrbacteria bacterium]
MESHSAPKPQTLFAVSTLVIMLIVLLTVWQKTLHRPDIRGTWTSQKCEGLLYGQNRPSSYQKQQWTFTGGEWTERIDYYSDADCTITTMSRETHGSYELGDASDEVEGATRGEFVFKTITLTPRTAETAQVFEQSRCGNAKWEQNVATEVGGTGCMPMALPISNCPVGKTIVKREGDILYLGSPTVQSCERIIGLSTTPLKKVE